MEVDFSQEDMESIQGGLDPSGATGGTVPSGFSSDLGSGDSAEDFNSFVTGLTPQQAYTTGRGATATNPFPESFFSRLLGPDKVSYTNILGQDRINEINNLRFRQATGLPSLKTGQPYQAGDFYIGQPTQMGVVKPIPSATDTLLNFLPGGGILNAFLPQKGLPEGSKEYQDLMAEEAKSANDPTIFDNVQSFVRSITGLGPKDSGVSLAASPTGDGQMRVPDTRTFDAFGNVTGSDLDTQDRFKTIEQLSEDRKKQNAINAISDMFQAKPKVQKVADLGQTFRNIRDTTKDVLGPDGVPVFGNENLRFRLGVDPEKQEPKAMFTYNFSTV